MSEHELRVGDAERDDTVSRLAEHFAAGRLNRSEFDERTAQALGARTRGDLDGILVDLPPTSLVMSTPSPASEVESAPVAARTALAQWGISTLAPWAVFGVFFIVLWMVTGAGYFWPMWPIMGWGIGVATSGIAAYNRRGEAS